MSLEGLHAILDKKEVVPTFSAEDLVHRAAQVEADYLYHVRTYLPINRAGEAEHGQVSIEDFERRLIKQVKEGKTPRGYITAGYGYGKTSTALYVWQRAQEANLVIVPPFTLSQLPDFLHAIYGWLRYKLASSRPVLIEELDQLYHRTIDRSLERIAGERGLTLEQMQNLYAEGLLNLELQAAQYMKFFEEATRIALEAGFEGLIVLPDEIQQYFRPKMKEGGDPIAPFFNIIQLLNTRAASASLRFGFVMIITLEELAQIRETFRRNDLLHRMKDLQIDLSTLYNEQFAPNLWGLMAERFEFEDEAGRICDPETLQALGEIVARKDLSDGPRTAINVFRRMVSLFLDNDGTAAPYSPMDLIGDFLDEQAIPFAGDNRIRSVTRRALQHESVQADFHRFAPAIKLAAAFPTHGVARDTQNKYGQAEALTELMRHAIGEVVRSGTFEYGAIALVGLDEARLPTAWLPTMVRELRLGYQEEARITQERAETTFAGLLEERIFVSPKWKYVEGWERSFVANRSLIFEGAFDSSRQKFPKKRVHVRLLWEDEAVKDAEVLGDVCLEFQLSIHRNWSEEDRRQLAEPLRQTDEPNTCRIPINLLYSQERVPPQIENNLKDVWSPYELSPLVLSAIYQVIEEQREDELIPKLEDGKIKDGFQPEILDLLVRNLFNGQVGEPVGSAGAELVETAVGILLESRYQDYHPLVVVQNWQGTLQKYANALRLLELPAQRQGDLEVKGTKEEIASLFALSNTGLDSFLKSFPDLLNVVPEFRGNAPSSVHFTLHPYERVLLRHLHASTVKDQVTRSRKTVDVRRVNLAHVLREGRELGYNDDEQKAMVELLQIRGLAEERQGWLVEVPDIAPELSELRMAMQSAESDLGRLADSFQSELFTAWREHLAAARQLMTEQAKAKAPDPVALQKIANALRIVTENLRKFALDRKRELLEKVKELQRTPAIPEYRLKRLDDPVATAVEYADQINAMLKELRTERDKLFKNSADTQKLLREAQHVLEREELPCDELTRQARSLPEYRTALAADGELFSRLDAQIGDFERWRDLSVQGQSFLSALSNLRGPEAEALKAEFDRLSTSIRGEISSHRSRLDALPLYGPYLQSLADLGEKRSQLESKRAKAEAKARDEFQMEQARYRELLQDVVSGNQSRWLDVPYNPNASANSREDVVRKVQTELANALKRLEVVARNIRQTLVSAQANLDTLSARDRTRLAETMAAKLELVEVVLAELSELAPAIRDGAIIKVLDNQLSSLVLGVVTIGKDLAREWEDLQQIRSDLQSLQPTSDEARVLDWLRAAGKSEVDLVELRSVFDSDSVRLAEAIQGLQNKDRITIHIQLKDD